MQVHNTGNGTLLPTPLLLLLLPLFPLYPLYFVTDRVLDDSGILYR